jgi:hypothetical protein
MVSVGENGEKQSLVFAIGMFAVPLWVKAYLRVWLSSAKCGRSSFCKWRTILENSQCAFNQMATAEAWARGWTLTRGKPRPINQTYGYKIDLGAPDHLERHVVTNFDTQALRELSGSLTVPGTWLKVCASPEMVTPFLRDIWTVQPPEYLMAAALRKDAIATSYQFAQVVRSPMRNSGAKTDN